MGGQKIAKRVNIPVKVNRRKEGNPMPEDGTFSSASNI